MTNLFLSIASAVSTFYFFTLLQDSVSSRNISEFFVIISLVQFYISFLNLGSEYRFVIDKDYNVILNTYGGLFSSRRLIYYFISSIFIAACVILFYFPDKDYFSQGTLFGSLFIFAFSQLTTQYFVFFLIKNDRNTTALFSSLTSILFILAVCFSFTITSTIDVLFLYAASSALRLILLVLLSKSSLNNLNLSYLMQNKKVEDKLFEFEWFNSYLGNPLGFLYVFLTNHLIYKNFEGNIAVCIQLCFRIINQILSLSSNVAAPYFLKKLPLIALTHKISTTLLYFYATGTIITLLLYAVVNTTLFANTANLLFKTVTPSTAAFYMSSMAPILGFGFVSGFFSYIFANLGGANKRNLLLAINSFAMIILILISQTTISHVILFCLVILDVIFNLLYIYILTKKLYNNN